MGWAVGLPATTLPLAPLTAGLSLLSFGAYPLLGVKVHRYARSRGFSPEEARVFAISAVASKFPQAAGMASYGLNRLRNKPGTLIEYKGAAEPARTDDPE